MEPARRRIAVVTGTRAEFGLLAPVMRAIRRRPDLELLTVAAGSHLLPPAETVREVRAQFRVDAVVPMQLAGEARTRAADAEAVGRGVAGFAAAFAGLSPDWVLVLGDRIEAFAAAAAASVGGWGLAHIHGGDRAEGVADEAMRHAITKLAHLHLAASAQSAERIVRMGEPPERVIGAGSPAIDGLADIPEMDAPAAAELGDPRTLVLLHPAGLGAEGERNIAMRVVEGVASAAQDSGGGVLWLMPNHDADREAIAAVVEREAPSRNWRTAEHLLRERFVGLLKRLAGAGGVLVGNSSAGLIEAAAVGVRVVNVGPRQAGRERAGNVIDVEGNDAAEIAGAIRGARGLGPFTAPHPYGDGRSGERIAAALAATDPRGVLRKRNAY